MIDTLNKKIQIIINEFNKIKDQRESMQKTIENYDKRLQQVNGANIVLNELLEEEIKKAVDDKKKEEVEKEVKT